MASSTTYINVPPAANYGRSPDGAARARNEYWNQKDVNNPDQDAVRGGMSWMAGEANRQRGPQAVENAGLAGNEASGAGGHQSGSIGLARGLALGQGPSEAAYGLQRGLDMSSAAQTAIGRSARGGAALATAGANANANTANLQQNAFSQAGMLRAQEMATGRGLYGSLLGKQREQDQARIGMANEMGQFNAGLNDRYRLGMNAAALGMGEVANAQDQQDFAYYQGGMNPVNAQSEAWQQYQQWRAAAEKQKMANNSENG